MILDSSRMSLRDGELFDRLCSKYREGDDLTIDGSWSSPDLEIIGCLIAKYNRPLASRLARACECELDKRKMSIVEEAEQLVGGKRGFNLNTRIIVLLMTLGLFVAVLSLFGVC